MKCVVCGSTVEDPTDEKDTSCLTCCTIYHRRNGATDWMNHKGRISGTITRKDSS